MDILAKIDKLRLERGWSINYMAMEAMLTQSTVNNLYTRKAEPKLSTLRALCNAFGISLADFFADEAQDKQIDLDEKIISKLKKLSNAEKKALLVLLNRK